MFKGGTKKFIMFCCGGVIVLGICIAVAVGGYFLIDSLSDEDGGGSEAESAELYLTSPTSNGWYETDKQLLNIGGLISGSDLVKEITWNNEAGGQGSTTITDDNWSASVDLEIGDNKITIILTDKNSETDQEELLVVYNPSVLFSETNLSQDYLYKGQKAEITVRTEIISDEKIDETYLFEVSGDGFNVVEKLGKMFDDGVVDHGDDIPGDGMYSGKFSFSAESDESIYLRVGANTGSKSFNSLVLEVKVIEEMSSEEVAELVNYNTQIHNKFDELKSSTSSPENAASQMIEWLSDQDKIESAGTSQNGYGVWWEFANTGILGGELNNPEGTKGGPASLLQEPEPTIASLPFTSTVYAEEKKALEVKSTKAIYLGPFLSQFKENDDYHGAWKTIKDSKCPECQTTEKKNAAVKVDDFKTLSNYGLIVISSHGDTWFGGKFGTKTGWVITNTAHKATGVEIIKYLPDLLMQRLAISASGKFVILPSFIAYYNGRFPNSLVYLSTCRSAYNYTMAVPYIGSGAKAFFGYHEYVFASYAKKAGGEMMNQFIVKGKDAKTSFDEAVKVHGPHDKDPKKPAYFKRWGRADLVMGGAKLQNGSFEEGLLGWQKGGDARVIVSLGSLQPKNGQRMAIISTGLGSVSDSNTSLKQKLCANEGKATLSFRYDVISEEPMEYVGSAYDDSFVASVRINGKSQTLVARRINNTSWKKIGGINFAGGDATTFHTGWRSFSKSIGTVKPSDTIEIVFRVTDKGDSAYDTAAIIDAVSLSVK